MGMNDAADMIDIIIVHLIKDITRENFLLKKTRDFVNVAETSIYEVNNNLNLVFFFTHVHSNFTQSFIIIYVL